MKVETVIVCCRIEYRVALRYDVLGKKFIDYFVCPTCKKAYEPKVNNRQNEE